ncbi:MAG: flagellar motor switch phosphatase FliY [Moorellales bacterium]
MGDQEFLSQEQIDALLQQAYPVGPRPGSEPEDLSAMEADVLGEIGNISMGSAATALSEILRHKVTITAPRVRITTPEELFRSFQVPYAIVTVEYTGGLVGSNLLIIKVSDATVIADLMMGGEGRPSEELSEIGVSAVAEAMNQMIGSAATAMSSMFSRAVTISPPQVAILRHPEEIDSQRFYPWPPDERIAVVSFRLTVEDLIDSELLQVVPVAVAKQEAELLLGPPAPEAVSAPADVPPAAVAPAAPPPEVESPSAPENIEAAASSPSASLQPPPRNLELLLDIPLEVSVVLGRTRRPIKEVLSLVPGSVVELEKLVEEPVEILVNGTLVAQGEVVVVNENFGVRITHIVHPSERLKYLR